MLWSQQVIALVEFNGSRRHCHRNSCHFSNLISWLCQEQSTQTDCFGKKERTLSARLFLQFEFSNLFVPYNISTRLLNWMAIKTDTTSPFMQLFKKKRIHLLQRTRQVQHKSIHFLNLSFDLFWLLSPIFIYCMHLLTQKTRNLQFLYA